MEKVPAPPASSTERLAGIEWMRGVAAFGVICMHSGLAVHNNTAPAAEIVRGLFGFAVPFFLLTSLFLAIRASKSRQLSWGEWFRRRSGRLLIPFAFWSAVYLGLHIAKLVIRHQGGEIKELFVDPVALVLSGGTAAALYFLPLLFMGLILTQALSGLFKRSLPWTLVAGFCASLLLYDFCCRHGYTYEMGESGQGNVAGRLLVKLLEHAVRCAPLVFAAALLEHFLSRPGRGNAVPLLAAGFLLLGIVHAVALPVSVMETVNALGGFALAWGLSSLPVEGRAAAMVGLFSFGVYLVHQVLLESIQFVYTPRAPVGVAGTLVITSLVYAASMLVVWVADRTIDPVRRVFGLK